MPQQIDISIVRMYAKINGVRGIPPVINFYNLERSIPDDETDRTLIPFET
jgi:hypothetical protein